LGDNIYLWKAKNFSGDRIFQRSSPEKAEKPEPKPIVISAEKTTAETRLQPIGPEEIITDSNKIQEDDKSLKTFFNKIKFYRPLIKLLQKN